MAIPRKVIIAGRDIKIAVLRGLYDATGDTAGSSDELETITLDAGRDLATTLIHELAHQVSHSIKGSQDEREITLIEHALVALIRFNPALCRWLVDQIAGVSRIGKQGKSSKRKRK